MLALKKKREAEKKQQEEDAKNAEANGGETSNGGGQVSLFGIGGMKKTKKGESTGTRKTPSEIRIQKGNFSIP